MDSSNASESSIGAVRSSLPLPPKTLIGFLLAVVAVAIIALLSYQSLQTTTATAANLTQTIEVLGRLQGLLSTPKDAETGETAFHIRLPRADTGSRADISPRQDR